MATLLYNYLILFVFFSCKAKWPVVYASHMSSTSY